MATIAPPIEIDIPPLGLIRFHDVEHLSQWAAAEVEFWRWLNDSSPPLNGLQYQPQPQTVFQQASQIANAAATAETAKGRSVVERYLKLYLELGLSSQSARGQFVHRLLEQRGKVVALGAVAGRLGSWDQNQQWSQQQKLTSQLNLGATALAAFDLGLVPDASQALEQASQRVLQDYAATLQRTEKRDSDRHAKSLAAQQAIEALAQKNSIEFKEDTDKGKSEIAEAIASLKAVETTYKEYMKLAAPVDYWTTKAKRHEATTKRRRWLLLGNGAVLGTALGYGLLQLAERGLAVAEKKDINLFAPLLFVGLGLVATTFFIWTMRILVRLYLSELHLGIDARERETMLQTYLALTNVGKVEPTDRALVLAPLFRPTADGVVKDDGAPEFGLAAQISKMGKSDK